jgi:RNA polymerase sigma factor (sigma-70 family)
VNIDDEFFKKYSHLIADRVHKEGVPKHEVDEYVGLVYERLLSNFSYDPERGKLTTWLGWVVKSVVSNERKRQGRSQDALDHSVGLEAANTVIGAEDAGTVRDELERVFAAAGLSDRDERIVRDFHLEGYSAIEIARKRDMGVHAVQKILVRAMKALRDAAE